MKVERIAVGTKRGSSTISPTTSTITRANDRRNLTSEKTKEE